MGQTNFSKKMPRRRMLDMYSAMQPGEPRKLPAAFVLRIETIVFEMIEHSKLGERGGYQRRCWVEVHIELQGSCQADPGLSGAVEDILHERRVEKFGRIRGGSRLSQARWRLLNSNHFL